MSVRTIALLLHLFIAAVRGSAQSWEVFDMTTAGFANNTVNDIAIDGSGIVWVGTNWGLCRYDGIDWTVYLTSNSGLTDNVIHALATDSLGRVWIGTQMNGVVVFDGSTWTSYTTSNSILPENEIKCLTIDHRGWVWIGTFLGLVCNTGTDWRLYDDTPSSYGGFILNGPVIEDVAVRSDGLVAIGTLNYGFHYLTDTSLVVHATYIDLFPDNTQLGVAFDDVHDERWLATPSQGLLRQGGNWWDGPWFQYSTTSSTIPTNGLQCIAMDATGRPWMGSALNGLMVRLSNGLYTNYTSANSDLPDNTIETLVFDATGALWVGTYFGGAARLSFPSGVVEPSSPSEISAYPNPFTDRIEFRQPTAAAMNWSLVSPQGGVVAEGHLPPGDLRGIDTRMLAPGAYVLRVGIDAEWRSTRMIKLTGVN